MSTCNGARFLPIQLQSILQQTVLPTELVVCDDLSSDTTLELLEAFQGDAPFPVRLFRNAERLGPAQNFARGISLCTGDIILLTDQDDRWLPDRIEQTRDALVAHPAATLAYSDAPLMGEDGTMLGRTLYSSLPVRAADRTKLAEGGDLLPVLSRYSVLCGATMAFRSSLRSLLLPVPRLWMHDEWIGLVANALGMAVRLQQPVMQYRQHAGQQLGTGNWTLATHLRIARSRRADFYEHEKQRLQNGIEALAPHPQFASTLLPLLQARRSFLQDRARIHREGLRALPALGHLLLSGGYARHASGLRSSAKDLAAMLLHSLRLWSPA